MSTHSWKPAMRRSRGGAARFVLPSALGLLVALAVAYPAPATAQGFLKKLKQRAGEKVADRVAVRTDEALDSLVNSSEHVIQCLATDQHCIETVQKSGKQVQVVDAQGKPLPQQPPPLPPAGAAGAAGAGAPGSAAAESAGGAASEESAPPGSGAWLNYDFVPGERTIWFEDFADDAVGDFPRRMGLIDGNLEVVDVKGHHYLRSADGGTVAIQLPEMLPERFTVEALFYGSGNPLMLHTTRDFNLTYFGCYHDQAFVHATNDADSHQTIDGLDPHAFIHCRFTIDRRYIKGYLNERRLANLPVADLPRTDSLVIQVPGSGDEDAALVTDIRVAAGGKKLYDLLLADGHVATHGILFATGSAQIRGESTPTLKEIGEMLATHADLRLVIEGHTDNVGNAAANLQLSRQRAEAVSAYLVSNYHVDPARLETRGLGDTKPVDTNATPEGRQNNRRVELVKR